MFPPKCCCNSGHWYFLATGDIWYGGHLWLGYFAGEPSYHRMIHENITVTHCPIKKKVPILSAYR